MPITTRLLTSSPREYLDTFDLKSHNNPTTLYGLILQPVLDFHLEWDFQVV